jgi:hypothetical protein
MKLETQLLSLQERLQDAVKVTYTALENEGEGYPFATGYSRSAMQGVIEDLGKVMDQMNNAQTIDF